MGTVDADKVARRPEGKRVPEPTPRLVVVGIGRGIAVLVAAGYSPLMQKLAAKHFQLRVAEA
jgi:hypothetical protein